MRQGPALAILGAGGHGFVVAEAAALSGGWADIRFFDDSPGERRSVGAWPLLGDLTLLLEQLRTGGQTAPEVIVAIGHNDTRASTMAVLESHRARFATVIHPRGFVSPSAVIGPGSAVLAAAVVNSRSQLGRGCIVNVGAIVDHDVNLGDWVHMAPGSVVAGGCRIGNRCWLGTGASMAPGSHLTEGEILQAGSVLTQNNVSGCK